MGQKTDKILERAKVNFKKGNNENALRLFNQVLNREPTHTEALRNKGLLKMMEGNYKEAEEFLLFAIDQQPKDDQLYQMLGSFYQNNNEPDKALAQFEKSIDLNAQNHLAHKRLGMLFANALNDHDNAVAHFNKAIEINNKETDLYFNRGCSNMILQDMTKAKEDFRKAADLGHSKALDMLDQYFS
ncbi:tetratricopeptide repeat protein [Fodinibius saliphilus]|uniref:tetratricopeptide repeat protein n=1 Tax=Fodinibius saliphilus TaxID=1920650 RepID=UPI001107B240|nr:tetratricopeptide repeat protein [Fodinibius saliphilus]